MEMKASSCRALSNLSSFEGLQGTEGTQVLKPREQMAQAFATRVLGSPSDSIVTSCGDAMDWTSLSLSFLFHRGDKPDSYFPKRPCKRMADTWTDPVPGVTFQLRQSFSPLLSTASLCSYMHNYYSSPGIVSPKPRDTYDLHHSGEGIRTSRSFTGSVWC